MSYLFFLLRNWRFLTFGMLVMLSSCFGQTYFISLFLAEIRSEFGLGHGEVATIYAVATFASGMTILWIGRKIDEIDLRIFSLGTWAGIIFATLFISFIPASFLLYIAFYLLRLTGQGLMTHIAVTSMARYFDRDRGKAISIATMGMPLGQAILPIVLVLLIAAIGWRAAWQISAVFIILALVPATLFLLKGHGARHRAWVATARDGLRAFPTIGGPRLWTAGKVVRDLRFWLTAPAVLAPASIVTGLIFHQVHIAASKGWSLTWLATTFAGYAVTVVATSVVAGVLIDRFTAVRVLPYSLPPLALSMLILLLFDHPATALPYMVTAGISVGFGHNLPTTVWAEIYGTAHLGAIRSVSQAMTVVMIAAWTFAFGELFDLGITVEGVAVACLAYVAAAMIVLRVSLGRPAPTRSR